MIEVASRSAEISPCRGYRYQLARTLAAQTGEGTCAFVMLNPSTADGEDDDQTIRRCLAFTQAWGYRRLLVANLFAWRATMPKAMYAAIDPVGVHNDEWILRAARYSDCIVCAWGAHGHHRARGSVVRRMLLDAGHTLYHLGLTQEQQPRHPLFLRADTERQPWV